jgi:hypothetical protein
MRGTISWFPSGRLGLAPEAPGDRVLVVGEAGVFARPALGAGQRLHCAEFDAVDAGLLARLRPDLVLAPLMGCRFDCVDLARILIGAGYRGAFRVLSPALPAPEMVRRELAALCPGLSIDLVEMAGAAGLSGRR